MEPHKQPGNNGDAQSGTNNTNATRRTSATNGHLHGTLPVDFDQLGELLEIHEVFNYNGYVVLEARIQQSARQDIELDNVYVQVREPEKQVSRKYSLVSSWRGLPRAPDRGSFGVAISDNEVNIRRGSAGEPSAGFEASSPPTNLAASENTSRPTTPSALSLRAHVDGCSTPELQIDFKQPDDENSAHFRRLGRRRSSHLSSYSERRDSAYFEALASASNNTTPAQRKKIQRRLSSVEDSSNSGRGGGDSFLYSRRGSCAGGGYGGGGNTPTTNQGLPSSANRYSQRQVLSPLLAEDSLPAQPSDSSPGNWDAFLAREEANERRHQMRPPFEVFRDETGIEEEDSRTSSFSASNRRSTAATITVFQDGDAADRTEPAIATTTGVGGGAAAAAAAAASANIANDTASDHSFYYNDGKSMYILISPIAANKQLELRIVCQHAQQRHRHRLSTGSSVDEAKRQSREMRTPNGVATPSKMRSISRTITLMAMDHSARCKRLLVWSMQQAASAVKVALPSDMARKICSYLLYDMPKSLHPASRIAAILANVPASKRIALRYVEGSIQAVLHRSPPKPALLSENGASRELNDGGRGGRGHPPTDQNALHSVIWARAEAQAHSWRRRSAGGESKADRSELESKVNHRTVIARGRRRRHTLPTNPRHTGHRQHGDGRPADRQERRRNQSQRTPGSTVVVSYPSPAQAATQRQQTRSTAENAVCPFESKQGSEASIEVYTSPVRVGPESQALSMMESRTHPHTTSASKETPNSSTTKLPKPAAPSSSASSKKARNNSHLYKAFKKTEIDIERKRRRSSYEAKTATAEAVERQHTTNLQSEQARQGSGAREAATSRSRGLQIRTSNPANSANIAAGQGTTASTAAGSKVKDRRRTGEGSKKKTKKSHKPKKKSTARL